jgi:hypothetical protein
MTTLVSENLDNTEANAPAEEGPFIDAPPHEDLNDLD